MKTKKQKVKEYVLGYNGRSFTLNSMMFELTGIRGGAKWHHSQLDVSKSTLRRAVNELVESKKLIAWYPVGHCFDECRYRLNDENSKID